MIAHTAKFSSDTLSKRYSNSPLKRDRAMEYCFGSMGGSRDFFGHSLKGSVDRGEGAAQIIGGEVRRRLAGLSRGSLSLNYRIDHEKVYKGCD